MTVNDMFCLFYLPPTPEKHAQNKQAAKRHSKNPAPVLRREREVGESLDKHLFIQKCRN